MTITTSMVFRDKDKRMSRHVRPYEVVHKKDGRRAWKCRWVVRLGEGQWVTSGAASTTISEENLLKRFELVKE